jgi:hypothetical protein
MPRLASIWQNRLSEAATTISPASIISMPMVKTMPCTAVTIGFRHCPFSANASTLPGVGSTLSAFGPKNFGISSPAVKLPSAQTTPTQ